MAASSTNPQPSSTHHQRSILPVYQSLATVNVANFVTVKLSGDQKTNNYAFWRVQMISLIHSHDLLHFIIDIQPSKLKTEPAAAADDGEGYDIWRTDMVVRGWIFGTILEHKLLVTVAMLATAREVWSELERRFEQEKGDVPIALGKSFFNVRIPLHQAALKGDWEATRELLDANPGVAKIWIDDRKVLTPLEVVVGTGRDSNFVKKLLAYIPDDESVALTNDRGATALHIAAAVGNIEAAIILVHRMPSLCYISDSMGDYPIQYAAKYAKRKMLEYLIRETRDDMDNNPYAGLPGLRILTYAMDAEFFDIASYLVNRYPDLAGIKSPTGDSALLHIIGWMAPLYNTRLTPMERCITFCLTATTLPIFDPTRSSDEKRDSEFSVMDFLLTTFKASRVILWREEPGSLNRNRKRMIKGQAIELIKLLCDKLKSLEDFQVARDIYENAILKAAEQGVGDAVQVIVDIFPLSIYARRIPSGRHIFHEAVENRSEDVFNLIYRMSDHKHLFLNIIDAEGNNILHLAGKLPPARKLNEISGVALQMQREIRWYKEVERLVNPSTREQENAAGKTPKMLFTEEHKNMKEEGEKWMKATANSCTIIAALIATVMFAAAITVPGGNHGNTGLPMFSKEAAYTVFAISDALSLFTSVHSLLLFLEILTSRCAEEDFFFQLPTGLIVGLTNLFLSITFMMISFTATLYLVFGRGKLWVLIIAILAVQYPVRQSLRVMLLPILFDLIPLTYSGIFIKKSNRSFY